MILKDIASFQIKIIPAAERKLTGLGQGFPRLGFRARVLVVSVVGNVVASGAERTRKEQGEKNGQKHLEESPVALVDGSHF